MWFLQEWVATSILQLQHSVWVLTSCTSVAWQFVAKFQKDRRGPGAVRMSIHLSFIPRSLWQSVLHQPFMWQPPFISLLCQVFPEVIISKNNKTRTHKCSASRGVAPSRPWTGQRICNGLQPSPCSPTRGAPDIMAPCLPNQVSQASQASQVSQVSQVSHVRLLPIWFFGHHQSIVLRFPLASGISASLPGAPQLAKWVNITPKLFGSVWFVLRYIERGWWGVKHKHNRGPGVTLL